MDRTQNDLLGPMFGEAGPPEPPPFPGPPPAINDNCEASAIAESQLHLAFVNTPAR